MAATPKMLDDVAKVMASAMGTAFGMREEVEARMRSRIQSALARMDLVTKDEFDAIRELAANARAEQEILTDRVAALEDKIATLAAALDKATAKPQPAPRKRTTTRKPAAKPAAEAPSAPTADDG